MTDTSDLILHTQMETRNMTDQKLLLEEYPYIFDKFSADHSRKFWRCEEKNECKARLHMNVANDHVIKQFHEQNRGSDVVQTEVTKIVDRVRRHAGKITEIPSPLINDVLQGSAIYFYSKIFIYYLLSFCMS